MKETKRARMPSPATVLALIALAVAIGGTAWAAKKITAKNLASNAVTTKKIKNSAVTEAKLGDGAVTTAKLANGAATAAKTGLRWALVDGNGTILAQSGGISLAFYSGVGDYYLSFGSSQAGKSIQVTPAFRDGDAGYGESAITGVCGGGSAGIACGFGPNTNSQVYVGISDQDGNPNAQAFYLTVF